MNVKLNDNVLVIAGKDKGKQGKVIATSPKANTVTVEGVRIQKKHEKARKANETSKIVEVPGPIDVSNVMVVCPVCGKATKVKHEIADGKKVRVCKCGATLDKAYVKKAKTAAPAESEAPKKRTRKRAAKPAEEPVAETTETGANE
ncbi:MAG: 50S ribosomal protein L24 [Candidatus Scatosoma sp.]